MCKQCELLSLLVLIGRGLGNILSLLCSCQSILALYNISLKKQIIVITHLAQIASFSTSHYFIDKYIDEGRTKIMIISLDDKSKIGEISRMLGGIKDSDISIKHARELIEKVNIMKKI